MRHKTSLAPMGLGSILFLSVTGMLAAAPAADAGGLVGGHVAATDARGAATFMTGRLGRIDMSQPGLSAEQLLQSSRERLGLEGREVFVTRQVTDDALGKVHVRLDQYIDGVQVVGADIGVHATARTGEVYAVAGQVAVPVGPASVPAPKRGQMLAAAVKSIDGSDFSGLQAIDTVYLRGADGFARLVWSAEISYVDHEGAQRDAIFVDPTTGEISARYPQIHHGLNREVYDANNSTSTPGTLLFTEGGSSSDAIAMAAYNSTGGTYDFYSVALGRDSYDDAGATIKSVVHLGNNYNNAYWDGQYIAFGDGDGTTFSPFADAFDVVAHELTHAVTERTAQLVYQDESGALNEAMSDIMGASAEAWLDGTVSASTWLIGEDCYTPGTAGDALRYMDDPTADGSSYDYYPERYTGWRDNGGVHLNSGIANLAYALLVDGGSHPRGKTSVVVPGVGIDVAQNVFYHALTTYMTSSTNFEGARAATAQAAADLYGASVVDAVHDAWNAVGVPGGPVQVNQLSNGVTVSGLSGSTGSEVLYQLDVPSGASNLAVTIAGNSGDADLYVRYGAAPTTSTYDCRPYKNGSNESCTDASPAAGTWYVMVRAYSSYSGLSLTGSFSGAAANQAPTAAFSASTSNLTVAFSDLSTDSDGSIASRSWDFGDSTGSSTANPSHTYSSAGTYTVTLTVTDNDGASDSSSQSVTVTAAPANVAPTASFDATATDLTVDFTDTSTDSDGSIASRSWSFGDGGSSSTANPSHTYASEGTYTVTLTVADNDGASDSTSLSVSVVAPQPTPTPGTGAPCSNCDLYSGYLSGSGDSEILPGGTYYYAGAGYHDAWLEGASGTDFDVYLYRWSGWGWSRVDSGTTSSSSEVVSYYGSAGYYYWKVQSYSGSGNFDFWLSTP